MTMEIEDAGHELLNTIKRHAGLAMAVGVLVAIAGALAIVSPFIAGLSVTIAVGVLLLVSGVSRLLLAFRLGSFGQGVLVFILGLLTLVAGGYMVARPGIGLATLTLFLAAYFFVHGSFEIAWSFRLRPVKGWGWTLFSGITSLVLGILIWAEFPVSGMWTVGTLAGIHMIFAGSATASIGSAAQSGQSGALAS